MRISLIVAVCLLATFAPRAAAQDRPRGPVERGVSVSAAPDLWVATPEGYRLFDVRFVHANEALGSAATYIVEATTTDRGVTAESLLGTPVTLGMRASPNRFTHVHGVVRSAQVRTMPNADGPSLQAVSLDIASPLYLLSASIHNRVFEDTTIADVVREVFAGHPGIPIRVDGRLPDTRQTFVQRDESDLELVQRLIQPEGCELVVEASSRQATAVVTDGRRRPRHVRRFGEAEGFGHFEVQRQMPLAYSVVRPAASAGSAARVVRSDTATGPYGRAEVVVQLPRRVSDEGARRVLAGLQMRSRLATAQLSDGPLLGCGDILQLRGHDDAALNRSYRVLASSWAIENGATGLQRHATVTLAPAQPTLPGRPPHSRLSMGLERVHVVAGPDGAPRIDAEGRVRIRFEWGPQPDGTHPELWVPVLGASPAAGTSSGFVMFEGGRPSAPYFVGRVSR